MITVPIIQAFFVGVIRLAAMGAALYLYRGAHGDMTTLGFAGTLAFFAMTGQALDVLHVARQVAAAQTTTSVTLQQPSDSPAPVQLTARTAPVAPTPQADPNYGPDADAGLPPPANP